MKASESSGEERESSGEERESSDEERESSDEKKEPCGWETLEEALPVNHRPGLKIACDGGSGWAQLPLNESPQQWCQRRW